VPQTFREVLGNTVMRRLWYAQIVSLFGDFLALFAVISVVTFRMHGTPSQITGLQIAYLLPLALLGPLPGVFVDRWPLKGTLVSSDLLRAGLTLLLLFTTQIWQVCAVLAAISMVSSFFAPAQVVAIRSHVPRHGLLSANALMQIAMMGSRIIGPATAGALVAALGPEFCYTIDVASFLLSAGLIFSVGIVRPAEMRTATDGEPVGKVRALWNDLREGLRFIFGHKQILFVVAAITAGLFTISCFGPLIAIYVRDTLRATALAYGIASGMIGVGLLAGTFVMRRLAARFSNAGLVLSGLSGIGVGALVLIAVPHIAAALAGTFLVGLTFAAIMVPAQTLIQQETPIALAGRVASTNMSLVMFGQVLGLLLSGFLANEVGVRPVFVLCAFLSFALAGAGWMVLRKGRKGREEERASVG
jgi:MFS family permease